MGLEGALQLAVADWKRLLWTDDCQTQRSWERCSLASHILFAYLARLAAKNIFLVSKPRFSLRYSCTASCLTQNEPGEWTVFAAICYILKTVT